MFWVQKSPARNEATCKNEDQIGSFTIDSVVYKSSNSRLQKISNPLGQTLEAETSNIIAFAKWGNTREGDTVKDMIYISPPRSLGTHEYVEND